MSRTLSTSLSSGAPLIDTNWRKSSSLPGLFALMTAAAADVREVWYAAAYKRLDQFVTRHMRESNTPGLVVAITNRERLLGVRSYGFSDLAMRTLVTPAMVFPIGSISKAFTATALLQVHEAGKVIERTAGSGSERIRPCT